MPMQEPARSSDNEDGNKTTNHLRGHLIHYVYYFYNHHHNHHNHHNHSCTRAGHNHRCRSFDIWWQ